MRGPWAGIWWRETLSDLRGVRILFLLVEAIAVAWVNRVKPVLIEM